MLGSPIPPSPCVTLSVCCEYDEVPFDRRKELLVMVTLKAASFPDEVRAPVDIVAVVDKSGSMKDDIHLVKKTLKFITSQLTYRDRLAIVSFNETVTIDLPLSRMSEGGVDRARYAIDGVTARGNTNLSDAILTGLRILRDRPEGEGNEVSSLLVFTDGRTNTGILSTKKIVDAMLHPDAKYEYERQRAQSHEGLRASSDEVRLRALRREKEKEREYERENDRGEKEREKKRFLQAEGHHHKKGQAKPVWRDRKGFTPQEGRRLDPPSPTEPVPCTVYTFGYGTSHNANMLKAICDVGGGIYYYIENESAISDSFADCLGGLLSVCAQDIKLTFQAENGTEIKKLLPASSANLIDGETCTFSTGDIQSEEQRDVLVQVTLPILKREEERTVLSLKLEYHNVLISKDETLRTSIYIKRVKSVSPDVEPNKAVQLCKLRIQTADAFDRANKLAKAGEVDTAREVLIDLIQYLSESKLSRHLFVIGLRNDLEECLGALKDHDSYTKGGGQQKLNSFNCEYHNQRNTRAGTKSMFSTNKKNNMLQLSRQSGIFVK